MSFTSLKDEGYERPLVEKYRPVTLQDVVGKYLKIYKDN